MATNGLLNKIKEALTSTQPHTAVCRLDAQKEPPKKEKKKKGRALSVNQGGPGFLHLRA